MRYIHFYYLTCYLFYLTSVLTSDVQGLNQIYCPRHFIHHLYLGDQSRIWNIHTQMLNVQDHSLFYTFLQEDNWDVLLGDVVHSLSYWLECIILASFVSTAETGLFVRPLERLFFATTPKEFKIFCRMSGAMQHAIFLSVWIIAMTDCMISFSSTDLLGVGWWGGSSSFFLTTTTGMVSISPVVLLGRFSSFLRLIYPSIGYGM